MSSVFKFLLGLFLWLFVVGNGFAQDKKFQLTAGIGKHTLYPDFSIVTSLQYRISKRFKIGPEYMLVRTKYFVSRELSPLSTVSLGVAPGVPVAPILTGIDLNGVPVNKTKPYTDFDYFHYFTIVLSYELFTKQSFSLDLQLGGGYIMHNARGLNFTYEPADLGGFTTPDERYRLISYDVSSAFYFNYKPGISVGYSLNDRTSVAFQQSIVFEGIYTTGLYSNLTLQTKF